MASVDFTPIGKRRQNTKFQVIRGHNADENRPSNRNLFHTLKDSTNIHYDSGDISFDDTTREWEDDIEKQAPNRPHKRTPRQETVFKNIGLGVNQVEIRMQELEKEALDWKIKYRELLRLVEQIEGDSGMIEANAELRSQLKLMQERLRQSEKNSHAEKYLLELEHKDKMINKLIEDMERMEREFVSHNNADNAELKHERLELKQKLAIYEEKLREYENLAKFESSEKQKQAQEDSQQIKKLNQLIKENDQIYKAELEHLKSLLENAEIKLHTAQREVDTLKEKAGDTSQVRKHFHADLNELNDFNQELRKQLDSQTKKLKQLQADLDALMRTNQDLLHQVEYERNKSNDLANDARKSNMDNWSFVNKLDKEKERVRDLVNELHMAQRAIERGKKEQAEMKTLLKEALSKNAENTHSNVDAVRMDELKKENSQLQSKVKELASHCQDLEVEVDSLTTKLKSKEKVSLEQEAHIQKLEEENFHLAVHQDNLASTNESLQNEAEKMKRDIQRCLQEIDKLENINDVEADKRVSQLLSNEHALKEEVVSLSKLATQLKDELEILKERDQDNKDVFDDNRELVRKLKEMQRILEDLGISSKEELEIFETNVRDRIMSMKSDLKDSDFHVRRLEDELTKSHEEVKFLQDIVVNKEEALKSMESLLNSDKKENESAIQAYQEFQLKKAREELNEITEQLRNTKLDSDAEIAKIQNSYNDKVKELKEQLSDYKAQLSNTTKDYRKLTDKLLEYKTNLKSVEDMERLKYYNNGWQYFKHRYRDATIKALEFKFMYEFAIDQIKSSRFKLNDDSKLAVVGLYPEYVGGSTKPKLTFKGVATLVLATIKLRKRTKFEKNRFRDLNKWRKELDDGRTKFKEMEKEKPFVVGIKTI